MKFKKKMKYINQYLRFWWSGCVIMLRPEPRGHIVEIGRVITWRLNLLRLWSEYGFVLGGSSGGWDVEGWASGVDFLKRRRKQPPIPAAVLSENMEINNILEFPKQLNYRDILKSAKPLVVQETTSSSSHQHLKDSWHIWRHLRRDTVYMCGLSLVI